MTAMNLKERIETLLSEILSDQHECKVTLKFEKKVKNDEKNIGLCG